MSLGKSAILLLELREEPDVLDGDDGLIGKCLQEAHLSGGELSDCLARMLGAAIDAAQDLEPDRAQDDEQQGDGQEGHEELGMNGGGDPRHQPGQPFRHWMTSSARPSTDCGIVSPSTLAAKPVTFPPGWATLETTPAVMGSPIDAMTMGTVLVPSRAAMAAGVPSVTIMSTLRLIASATNAG